MQPSKNTCIEGGMEQRFSLEAAGKLFGISTNAMRARVKKSPEKYRMERDNGGKIWLWIDPENLPAPKISKASTKGSKLDELKASIDALKERTETVVEVEKLKTKVELLEHQLDELRQDRDAWKKQATALLPAPRKRRNWWPWGKGNT